jgi:AraC-like DNA-binding protein
MMTQLLAAVRGYTEAHADRSGVARTPIRGFLAIRATKRTSLVRSRPRPFICLVLQGTKHVANSNQSSTFKAGDSMVISADVPTWSQITGASAAAPYFALALDLDPALISELTMETTADRFNPGGAPDRRESTDTEVADSALRLMHLLERPNAVPVLSSHIVREMHYWLLMGRHGRSIRSLGSPDGNFQKVARAVAFLQAEFRRPVSIERLAVVAGMSSSSFHRHFRDATSLSPLQFQKQLRLIEARRMMMSEAASTSNAAFSVGYESISQFTREYRRMFGLPPVRDVRAASVCQLAQDATIRNETQW